MADPRTITTVASSPKGLHLDPRASQITTIVPTFLSEASGEPTTVVDTSEHEASSEAMPLALARNDQPRLRYRDKEMVGMGGMGCVYRVLDQDLNRVVAMKTLSLQVDSSLRHFVTEAQISAQLEHPSILPIHDVGIDSSGQAFFTMRYVLHHETLGDIIARLRAGDEQTHALYSMQKRVQIIQRLCHALDYAHARGVVHRDIKPSNVLVGSTGEVYLADWGVARLMGTTGDDAVHTSVVDRQTPEGGIVGTPMYMSPEQLLGQTATPPQSDIYSLCAVAYEFFSLEHYLGKEPPTSYKEVLAKVLEEPRIDADQYFQSRNGRVPRELTQLLAKGLQKQRSAAFSSVTELDQGLQHWIEGLAPVKCPVTLMQFGLTRWRRAIDTWPRIVPALSLTIMLMLLACVVFTVFHLLG